MARKDKEKKLAEEPVVEEEEVSAVNDENDASDTFIPNEKLQAYYNEAYISERDRLNAMFGRIDTYPVTTERIVYRDPDLSDYVHVSEYKKKSRAATVFGVLFGIAVVVIAAIVYIAFIK